MQHLHEISPTSFSLPYASSRTTIAISEKYDVIYWPCKIYFKILRSFYFINSYVIFFKHFYFTLKFYKYFPLTRHVSIVEEFCSSRWECYPTGWSISVSVHNALGVMETVGKQVQVVSGLGVGGPVGPVGPVGGDLHHHHHPHPHAHPPHSHSHPHGHPHGSHGHSLATSNPGRGQPQPPTSHNQHLPARSTPVQLHR